MKKAILYRCMILTVSIFMLSSCKDLFETDLITKNPNAAADATTDVLLSGSLTGLSVMMEDTDVRIAMMWSGQLTGLSRQHLTFAQYIVSSGTFDWNNLYPVASNARLMQINAAKTNNRHVIGIGQVIESLLIAKAAVLYGDVPYSQAFDIDKFPKPAYDKQSDVYNSLQATLTSAIANLSSTAGLLDDTKDFIYSGDVAAWAEAAYTLKARLYLHVGDYANAIASAQNGISSPAGDFLIPHGETYQVDQNLNNVFFDINRPGDTGCQDPTFLPSFMKGRTSAKNNEDALFSHYFAEGIYTDGLDPNTIDGFFQPSSPHPVVTYFENQLILAEALARQGSNITQSIIELNKVREKLSQIETDPITGDTLKTPIVYGQQISLDYIREHGLKRDPYTAVDFNPGGVANPASSGRNQQAALIYEIISQKYILMYAQLEAYNDIRRCAKATPVVQLGITPIVTTPTGRIPDRFIYPQNAINTNPNVPKNGGAVADQFQKLEIFN